MASYSEGLQVPALQLRPVHSDVRDFLERFEFDEITTGAVDVYEIALAGGFVRMHHLQRTFDSLAAAGSLPRIADEKFARHFVDWLEIIHQPYFKPIITAPGRLDALIGLLNDKIGARNRKPGLAIVDFGTGQPPFTTMDLATRFPDAAIDGIDLYSPTHMVSRSDGAYALYEGDRLVAVHSADARLLHAMVLNWETTKHSFDRLLARPERGAKVVRNPGGVLMHRCPNQSVKLHRGSIGTFHLPPVPEVVDVIWSFNCLLHYPLETRVQALRTWVSRLRPGGIVMEGYTSPSGWHAVYCFWRRRGSALVLEEFGFTMTNLRYPLWPLYERDPQVELLNDFVRTLKASPGGPNPAALRAQGLRCRRRPGGFLAVTGKSIGCGEAPRITETAGGYPQYTSC